MPALQVMIGGGTLGNAQGRIADKVIKVPSKRGALVLKTLLADYDTNALDGEYFNDYYSRLGKDYFYQMLKPLADTSNVENSDFIDWGHEDQYKLAIGVGECAGVVIDLVATLLFETQEKIESAKETLAQHQFADSIYHSYSALVGIAKAILLDNQVHCNTQHGIINDFSQQFSGTELLSGIDDFKAFVMRINKNEPSEIFAKQYLDDALNFLNKVRIYRDKQLTINHIITN